jgi:chromate transporter
MKFLFLFLTFFKIGAFTFGGGYAMLPFIQQEVLANKWMSIEEITDFIAVSESTPGPFAINMATFIGNSVGGEFGVLGGIFGAFCATLGVVLPSFVIILIVAGMYEKFKTSKVVAGCMTGLRPAVIGFIGAAALSIAATVFVPNGFSLAIFKSMEFYVSAVIFIIGAFLTFYKKVHPIIIICISAVLGILAGYLLK